MFTVAYHALCNPFVMIVYRSPLGAIRYAQSVCSYRWVHRFAHLVAASLPPFSFRFLILAVGIASAGRREVGHMLPSWINSLLCPTIYCAAQLAMLLFLRAIDCLAHLHFFVGDHFCPIVPTCLAWVNREKRQSARKARLVLRQGSWPICMLVCLCSVIAMSFVPFVPLYSLFAFSLPSFFFYLRRTCAAFIVNWIHVFHTKGVYAGS
jgi:hypothetical protein